MFSSSSYLGNKKGGGKGRAFVSEDALFGRYFFALLTLNGGVGLGSGWRYSLYCAVLYCRETDRPLPLVKVARTRRTHIYIQHLHVSLSNCSTLSLSHADRSVCSMLVGPILESKVRYHKGKIRWKFAAINLSGFHLLLY